jgi:TRAP-type C4-dicarboxylate transport system substrate-binding protein
MGRISRRGFVTAAASAMVISARPARAQEVTLKTVSAWTEGTAFSRAFERFVSRVNETGGGVIKLNYLGGGGKILNPFDMGQALRRGVFDMINTNSAYYSNLIPESNAIKLSRVPIQKLRQNGGYEYLNGLIGQKVNAHFLGQGKGDVPFHVYLGARAAKVDGPDFSKLKLRVTPNYRAFFGALGATLVQAPPSEIYTALERGVVDGYGWPIQGIDELGLVPVTRFRIDPGFFVAPNEILINLDVWKKLGEPQRKVLNDAVLWTESWLDSYEKEENDKARKLQADANIQVITFTGADATKYINTAYDSAWKEVIESSPQHGPKLRELLS